VGIREVESVELAETEGGAQRPAGFGAEGGVVERQLAQIAHAGGVGEPRRVDFHQLELVEVDRQHP